MVLAVHFVNDEVPPHFSGEIPPGVWAKLRGIETVVLDHAKMEEYPNKEKLRHFGCDCEDLFLVELGGAFEVVKPESFEFGSVVSRAWVCRRMLEMD